MLVETDKESHQGAEDHMVLPRLDPLTPPVGGVHGAHTLGALSALFIKNLGGCGPRSESEWLPPAQNAHIPKGTERGPHDVIPLMEVYNKSLCRPRELLIEILQEYPEEVEHLFLPSCVVLRRCAGCCTDEMLQCTPTATYNVTMQVGKRYL
ncbi:unnamed protein product [Tetraodon nigroviridis]|uniref:(spotted green pufferfish) hypothetical protein n=1 Tax=Tetraodon nigroviridis TaxID=99883 RepID=Q4SJ48_TETNG|nr:unnamed protein product [Tetraodon nigroviridis]